MTSPDHGYGWPPRMLMRIACSYTGRSRWALARAVREGTLQAAGRNGRSLCFDRSELDRWMTQPIASPMVAPSRSANSTSRSSAGTSSDALARLRALTGGAR